MKIHLFALLLAATLLLAGCGAPAQAKDMRAPEHPGAAAATQTPATAALTKEEAQAIALEHAGFAADQVSRLRAEYEVDDGIPQYEVEFHQGRWEYSYEIHAENGTILSYDTDD